SLSRSEDPSGGRRINEPLPARSRPFPAAQNLSLGLRYLLLTHGRLKCHTADATASRGAAPVTYRYAQKRPRLLPPAPVTDELWPAQRPLFRAVDHDPVLAFIAVSYCPILLRRPNFRSSLTASSYSTKL